MLTGAQTIMRYHTLATNCYRLPFFRLRRRCGQRLILAVQRLPPRRVVTTTVRTLAQRKNGSLFIYRESRYINRIPTQGAIFLRPAAFLNCSYLITAVSGPHGRRSRQRTFLPLQEQVGRSNRRLVEGVAVEQASPTEVPSPHVTL